MNNEFSTIDTNDLDNVTGGRGRAVVEAVKKGAQWAWKNVVGPMGGGAAWEAASQWMSGGRQQPPQQPPQQGQ
jgi:bacteriocin-like protein